MKHPLSRAERRHNGDTWRNRQRFVIRNIWFNRSGREDYWLDNNTWWARKRSFGHGNRCLCHYEKFDRKSIRKRRRALDMAIIQSIKSHL
jgi:hypothetical protein